MAATQRIVVTGANKGIGLALVSQLLSGHPNSFVFLGSRSEERGKAALSSLPKEHLDRVEVLTIDVNSDESVQNAAKLVKQKYENEVTPLYALVNNAGIYQGDFKMKDVINTNVYGIHRTTDAFSALLEPGVGRVVNVTSAAGPNFVAKCSDEYVKFFLNKTSTPISFPILSDFIEKTILPISEPAEDRAKRFGERGLGDGSPYHVSKALANLLTIEIANRYPNLNVNSCTPGFINTDMTQFYAKNSGKTPEELGMKTPEQGTKSSLHLLFGDVKERGCYFGSDAKRSPLHKYRSPGAEEYKGEED